MSSALPAGWDIVAASFVAAAHTPEQLPAPVGVEVAFAGRSNVGKSSLMNALLGRRRLVRTSGAPGCTRQLNFFRAQARDGATFHLVDLPGYGYAKRSKAERSAWARQVEQYLAQREGLRAVVLLVDARRGLLDDDRQLLAFVGEHTRGQPRIIVVATKFDKVRRSRRLATLCELSTQLGQDCIAASAVTGEGTAAVWRALRDATLGGAAGP